MRFKDNVIDRLTQVEGTLQRIQVQLNRGASRNEVADTVEDIKNQIGEIRELISTEHDEFS